MKKNRGFIYIHVILLVTLMSILFYFIYAYINRSSFITYKKEDVINSEYKAESLINIILADDNFRDEFKKFYLSESTKTKITPTIIPKDLQSSSSYIEKSPTRNLPDRVILFSEVKYKNIDSKVTLSGSGINDFYKDKSGIITSDKVKPNKLKKMKDAFINFRSDGDIIRLNGDFIFKRINNKPYIFEEQEVVSEETGLTTVEVVPIHSIQNKDIILQESGTLEVKDDFNLASFLIINDKVIFNDYKIFGIIILNEGAKVSKINSLEGYLVNFSSNDTYTNVEYNKNILDKFRNELPYYVQFEPIALQNNIN